MFGAAGSAGSGSSGGSTSQGGRGGRNQGAQRGAPRRGGKRGGTQGTRGNRGSRGSTPSAADSNGSNTNSAFSSAFSTAPSAFSSSNPFQSRAALPRNTDTSTITPPGFKPRPRTPRPTPSFLTPNAGSVKSITWNPDKWDLSNQKAMARLEQQFSLADMQTLYEQSMRERERAEMEKRGLVDRLDVRKKLEDAISFVGTCTDMCPIFERVRRTYENNVKALEKDPVSGKATRQYAIKAFSRPAAGQPPALPSDVRPPHILKQTLDYLVDNVVAQLPTSHSLIWDRTRSIRQDFTYQNYTGPEAIECHERIARLHLVCLHFMAGSEQEYSQQQELEQFNKTLQSLGEFYDDNRKRGLPDSPFEPEMRGFQLLSHLRDPDIELLVQKLPRPIFDHPLIQLALDLRALVQQNVKVDHANKYTENAANFFASFFRRLRDDIVPPLFLCLLESSFNEIRLCALRAMARSYHNRAKPYYIDRLTEMLGFDSTGETTEFCEYYGLKLSHDPNGPCVDITSYNEQTVSEKAPRSQAFSQLVERRVAQVSVSTLINGVTVPGLPLPRRTSSLPKSDPKPRPAFSFSAPENIKPPNLPKAAQSAPTVPPPGKPSSVFSFGAATKSDSSLFATKEPSPFKAASSASSTGLFPSAFGSVGSAPEVKKPAPVPVARPVAVPTVTTEKVPVSPKPPKVEKPVYSDTVVMKQVDKMLRRVINSELSTKVLPEKWQAIQNLRASRQTLINTVSSDLYSQMVAQMIKKQTAKAFADNLYSRRMRSRAIKKIGQTGEWAKVRSDIRKKRREEFTLVSQLLGRSRPVRRSNSADLSKHRLSQQGQIDLIRKSRNVASSIWEPLDVDGVILSHVEAAFKREGRFTRNVTMSLFSNDWDSTSGQWLRKKLRLEWSGKDNESYQRVLIDKSTKITISALQASVDSFREIGMLVFSTSGDSPQARQYDSGALREILTQVTAHSELKLSVLVLTWDGRSSSEVLADLDADAYVQSSLISEFLVSSMATEEPSEELSSAVEVLAGSFTAELSSYGLAVREEAAKKKEQELKRKAAEKERERLAGEEARRQTKWNRINALSSVSGGLYRSPTSPKRKRSMTELAFAERNIPVVRKRIVTPPVPKAISELKDLVNSVFKRELS